MPSLANLTGDTNGITAIKFYADWCRPCKLYAPVFERAKARHPDVQFLAVDIDESPEIKEALGVQSVPMTLFVKDGVAIDFIMGAQSTAKLDAAIEKLLP